MTQDGLRELVREDDVIVIYDVETWEETLEDRRLIKHMLALYSDVEAAREQRINVTDCDTN
ncbi:hypothetical protein NP511_21275 [Natrinema thermotolerans]|uniref:Uncharacterized protein n=1 Tax=Natrinema thermotolerans TaxID=121872 RepID=A0AAF0PFS5_9EURY|nr:hypothetical protein [Natrinema thermotolerans]WMT07888.1 hypothetical protein NP511_21275 [Natrinema thermotolerans]